MSFVLRRSRRSAVATAAPAVDEDLAVPVDHAMVYVGLVTRTIAFALDAAVVNGVAILTAGVITLSLSVVSLPDGVETAVAAAGGVLYVVWTVAYFVTFWATTGQTPGNRLLGIRVHTETPDRLGPARAVLRFAGLTLAALPLGAGFLLILVDDRRRGLHDRLAGTVVVEAVSDDSVRRMRPQEHVER